VEAMCRRRSAGRARNDRGAGYNLPGNDTPAMMGCSDDENPEAARIGEERPPAAQGRGAAQVQAATEGCSREPSSTALEHGQALFVLVEQLGAFDLGKPSMMLTVNSRSCRDLVKNYVDVTVRDFIRRSVVTSAGSS
jgi:hypothetical protein